MAIGRLPETSPSRRRSRHHRQPYRFESLEPRRLLACQVFHDQDGTLVVIGDDAANKIEILGSEKGVQVTCDGHEHGTFASVDSLRVQAGDGEDAIAIDNRNGLLGGIAVEVFGQGGNDNPLYMASGRAEGWELGEFSMDGGDGFDSLIVIGGPGGDVYDINPGPEPNGGRIKGYAQVTGTATVCVDFEDVESTKVETGDGDDDVNVTLPLPTDFYLFTGDGNDVFRLKYTMFLPDGTPVRDPEILAFEEAADMGDGKDRVSMQGTEEEESFEVMGVPDATVPDPHVRITDLATKLVPFDGLIVGAEAMDFETAGGKDQFTMSDARGSLGGIDFNVDTGDEDDLVNVEIDTMIQTPSDNPGAGGGAVAPAFRQDPLLAFRFALATGDGDDTAFFKSVGGLKYESEVVDYQAGGGNDKLDIQIKSPRDPASFTHTVAPGAGNDEVLVALEHGDIRHPYVLGAVWNDTAPPNQGGDQTGGQLSLDILADGNGLAVGLGLAGTAGSDKVNINIVGACQEQKLDISTGDADDAVAVRVANPAPGQGGEDPEAPDNARRSAPTSINTGGGNDKVKFEETGLIVGKGGEANWSFLGGAGNDEFDLRVANAQAGAEAKWNWTTDTAEGDDLLKVHLFEIDLGAGSLTDWSFLTGEGSDNIDFVRCFMDIGPGSTYGWRLGSGGGDDMLAVMILDVNFGAGVKAAYGWDAGPGKNEVIADVSGLTIEQHAQLNWSWVGGEESDQFRLSLNDLAVQPGGSAVLDIATRGGNDSVEQLIQGRFDGELHAILGEGDDGFTFDAPQGLVAAAIPSTPCQIVEAGGGNDSVTFRLGGPLDSNLEIDVSLGEGNDDFALDAQQGWQAAAIPNNPCGIVGAGGGNDSVVFRFGGPVTANLGIDVSLGDGINIFLLDSQAGWNAKPDPQNPGLQPSVKVIGGAQRDTMIARLGPVSGKLQLDLDGQEGNDALAANLVFAELGQGAVDIKLAGGLGNDLLTLLALGQSNPQPTRLVINGGAGIDIAFATPNVDVFNCEVVIGGRRRR